jgi:hypothetical protein
MVLLAKLFKDIYDNQKIKEKDRLINLKQKKGILKSTSQESIDKEVKDDSLTILVILLVIYLIMSFTAAYFSWKHNTKIGWGTGAKIIFALFVFLIPFEYLSIYLTYKSDLLTYMERTNTEFVPPIVSPDNK